MESGRQFRDSLANTMKHDKRSKLQSKSLLSTRASFFMFFFSCLAWLYVAGRLWQNSENRTVLSQILQKHSIKVPKIFTFEDKIKSLQCKNLEKRIVDSEMDITFAKSQGYLRNQMMQKGTLSGQKFLAVVGVYTGFGSHSSRESFRKSWMPTDDALKKLEERGVILRFVIGRSANRGDSLDRNVDNENHRTKDFLILEGHEEAQEELAKKVKFFFSTAVEMWNAEFYVKLDDNIKLDLDGLITFLENRQGQESAYIGCMKSGDVIVEEGKQWYEPDWWKFGDGKSYFRHASGTLLILSEILARYISINSASLKTYAHDDISIGSWMMGINATYVDDGRLCCRSSKQDKLCSTA